MQMVASHSEILQTILQQNPKFEKLHLPPPTSPSARVRVANTLRLLPILGNFVPAVDLKKQHIKRLLAEQKSATTFRKWYDALAELDELLGSNAWKTDPLSPDYDYQQVELNLQEMRQARLNGDHKLLLYLVRTKWSRNFANMGDPSLYRHSHVGTKRLIEEYIEECQKALSFLVSDESAQLDDRYLLGMLVQTRKNIGRTALVLSGGSTFGFSHIGVLIALLENNLLPRVISGSSAGLIIACILCTHTNEETAQVLEGILERRFDIFCGDTEPSENNGRLKSLLDMMSHLLKYGTVFDISGVRNTVYAFVGDLTFREAYYRTGKILNITVSPASTHEQTRLLNYLTAPHCLIWSAVCASCSVPGIFASNSIYEKNLATNTIREWNNDQSLKFMDGSVDGDLPIMRLSEMFNVDHIIAVQVNPHVSPVLKVFVGDVGSKTTSEMALAIRKIVNGCYDFLLTEVIHYLQILNELNIQKNVTSKLISILTQRYSGDITILPDLDATDFLSLFSNPSPEFVLDFMIKGARAAWPKIAIINNHCGIEFALDKEISQLRGRIIANANKRLTSGEQTEISTAGARNRISNDFLISYPVVSKNESFQDTTGGSRKLPMIRRHNSVGFSSTHEKKSSLLNNKGQSLGTESPQRSSLAHYALFSPIKKERSLPTHRSDANIVGMSHHYQKLEVPDSSDDGLDMKRAFISGNFSDNESLTDTTTNTFNFRTSPKHERTIHHTFDYEKFAIDLLKHDDKVATAGPCDEEREKPNLPKRSKANSLSNSGIGLDVLKDSLTSAHNSTPNLKINSSKNLKDFYEEHEQTLKKLNSPDLRRSLSKHRKEREGKKASKNHKVTFANSEKQLFSIQEPMSLLSEPESDATSSDTKS